MDTPTKSRTNPRTTNYPKDSHREFCDRCYAYNKSCPNTRSVHKDHNCSL